MTLIICSKSKKKKGMCAFKAPHLEWGSPQLSGIREVPLLPVFANTPASLLGNMLTALKTELKMSCREERSLRAHATRQTFFYAVLIVSERKVLVGRGNDLRDQQLQAESDGSNPPQASGATLQRQRWSICR